MIIKILNFVNFAKSKREAIRLIKQGAVKIDSIKITNPEEIIEEGIHIISCGKKQRKINIIADEEIKLTKVDAFEGKPDMVISSCSFEDFINQILNCTLVMSGD